MTARPSTPPRVPVRVVDLTGPIATGMWDYRALDLGDVALPGVAVEPLADVATHGFAIDALRLTSLSGAYVETAAHTVAGAPLLGDLAAARFVLPARVMRLPPAAPRTLYRTADLVAADPGVEPGEALLIDTGWGSRWGLPGYVTEAPALAVETVDWLAAQPFAILAVDTPVLDCLWWNAVDPPHASEQGRSLLGELYRRRSRDLTLVAPLVHLGEVGAAAGTLVALPLNIPTATAAPCRVIFLEGVRLSARSAP